MESFAQRFKTLLSWSAVSQLIPILLIPILIKIYQASSFGIFGLFSAIVNIFASVGSLRYELAIPQQNNLRNAECLALACCIINISICFFIFFTFYLLLQHWNITYFNARLVIYSFFGNNNHWIKQCHKLFIGF